MLFLAWVSNTYRPSSVRLASSTVPNRLSSTTFSNLRPLVLIRVKLYPKSSRMVSLCITMSTVRSSRSFPARLHTSHTNWVKSTHFP